MIQKLSSTFEDRKTISVSGTLFYILLAVFIYFSCALLARDYTGIQLLAIYWSFTFIFYCALFRISKWLFALSFVPLALAIVAIAPSKVVWGEAVTLRQMLLVSFYSNVAEAKEYFQMLPWLSYAIGFGLLLISSLIFFFGWKHATWKKHSKPTNKRINYLVTFILFSIGLVGLLKNPLKIWCFDTSLSRDFKSIHVQEYGARVSNNALGIIAFQAYLAIQEVVSMQEAFSTPPSWKIEGIKPRYQDYILIIGESAAADYMSLYGYPIPNSLFLETCPNIKIASDYYSPAPNTANSLVRYLSWSNNPKDPTTSEYILSDNIISLSKAAGFETYWISTQRKIEGNRSPIGYIAETATHSEFICDEPFWGNICKDSHLLPKLEECLLRPSSHPRLFVVHLMGSHFVFEERLEEPLKYNHYNPSISAYLQTLEQTDSLIKMVYQLAKLTNRSFSITYFSDHGLEADSEGKTLVHAEAKEGYHVPFIQISSDQDSREVYHGLKHGGNFMHGFAEWIGVKESRFKSAYSFFKTDAIDSTKRFYTMRDTYVQLEDMPSRPILGISDSR